MSSLGLRSLLLIPTLSVVPLWAAKVRPAQLPLVFEQQNGQFVSHAGRSTLRLSARSITFEEPGYSPIEMTLVGSNQRAIPEAESPQASYSNYYIGPDPKRWRTHVPHYGQVRYREIYSGVDLVFHGSQRQLEYDFVLAPHADLRQIDIAFTGIERFEITADGDLSLHTPRGVLRQHAPVVYQDVKGERRTVAGRYIRKGRDRIGFTMAAYDRHRPLVIDPVLTYSTYYGGSDIDQLTTFAVDPEGNAYLGGWTTSTDLPVTYGASNGFFGGFCDGFVAKINPAGTALVYATYFGGGNFDFVTGIAVDRIGNAYVGGYTQSDNFPVTPGAYRTVSPGSTDGFALKLTPSGQLVYSTYLSGVVVGTVPQAIAVDADGRAFLAGAAANGYPTSPGAYQMQVKGNSSDAFVTVLNPSGTNVVYSTLLGGSGADGATGIAITKSGNAVVVGYANQDGLGADFPTTPGVLQPNPRGGTEGFVAELNSSGSALVFSTLLGGSGNDIISGIALDAADNIYIAGSIASPDFPISTPGSGSAASLVKLDPVGSKVMYAVAANPVSPGDSAIALDSQGNVYLVGSTDSSVFPSTPDALLPADFFARTATLTRVNSAGVIDYATRFGGDGVSTGVGVGVDASGNVYLAGDTTGFNLPTTNGVLQPTHAGSPINTYGAREAFVAKISMQPGTCTVAISLSNSLSLPASSMAVNGTVQVMAPAGCPWAATIYQNTGPQPWISLTTHASGVGSGTFSYSALPNTGSSPQLATLVVNDIRVAITQAGLNCTYSLDSLGAIISGAGGAGSVQIITGPNCPWTASASTPWVTLGVSSGIGSATIPYTVEPNWTSSSRMGSISIAGLSYSINQPSGCQYTISPTSAFLPASGGTVAISIVTSPVCSWGATAVAGVQWLPPIVNGVGSQTLTLNVPPNPGAVRAGIYLVTDVRIAVTQAGDPAVQPRLVTKLGVFRPSGQGGVLWVRDRDGDGLFAGSGDSAVAVNTLGAAGDQPLIGDWNGSGTKKLGVYRPFGSSTPGAGLFVLDVDGNEAWNPPIDKALFFPAQAGDVALVGQWNGGTQDRAGIFRNGVFYLDVNGDGSFSQTILLGQAGDIPVVGDWNGDGRTKVGVFRNGLWVLDYNGNGQWDGTTTDRAFYLGTAGDQPVIGDWNGDGRKKAGVFRTGTSLFVLDYNGNGQWDGLGIDRALQNFRYDPHSIALVGDWSGDGRDKVGVFIGGTISLDLAGNGGFAGLAYIGQSADVPIVGRW